jgi:hypothetical protein
MSDERDVFVSMTINGKPVKVHNPVKTDFEDEGEDKVIMSFMAGDKKLDKIVLTFEGRNYVNGEEEETTDN